MSDTVTVWNITLATKETPTDLHMYGKVIRPGVCAKVDGSWIRQYPKPLADAQANKNVYIGESLPEWYDEEQMKKITHKGQSPSILKGKGFHPTQMKPGDSVELEDGVVEGLELDDQPWMQVEEAKALAEALKEEPVEIKEEPKEEALVPKKKKASAKKEAKEEAPVEEAPKKKRNLRRKKKD